MQKLTLAGKVALLERQQAMIVHAIRLLLEARWTGEMPHAEAVLKAVDPAHAGDWQAVPFPGPAADPVPTEPTTPTRPILNTEGEDIRGLVETTARDAGIDPEFLLAGMIAESGLNPRAERWGTRTAEARGYARSIAEVGYGRDYLETLAGGVWPDISFGYGQRIVQYHYYGDGSARLENVLYVRNAVFADPDRDVREMAAKLRDCYDRTWNLDMAPVQGNHFLGALVVYNHGSFPAPTDSYWTRWAGNVSSYRAALIQAREMLGSSEG